MNNTITYYVCGSGYQAQWGLLMDSRTVRQPGEEDPRPKFDCLHTRLASQCRQLSLNRHRVSFVRGHCKCCGTSWNTEATLVPCLLCDVKICMACILKYGCCWPECCACWNEQRDLQNPALRSWMNAYNYCKLDSYHVWLYFEEEYHGY